MNPLHEFPRELKFLRFIFAIGAGAGLLLLIIGILGLFVGNVLKLFSGDPGSLAWTLNFLAFGLLGTIVSIRVFQLLFIPEPSSPGLILMWVWWLVLGENILSLIASIHSGSLFDLNFNQMQNLMLWSFLYVMTSSQLRFLKVVRAYYGALAPPSRIAWMNQFEQWVLRTMKLEQGEKV